MMNEILNEGMRNCMVRTRDLGNHIAEIINLTNGYLFIKYYAFVPHRQSQYRFYTSIHAACRLFKANWLVLYRIIYLVDKINLYKFHNLKFTKETHLRLGFSSSTRTTSLFFLTSCVYHMVYVNKRCKHWSVSLSSYSLLNC